MDGTEQSIGSLIRRLRRQRNLTQIQLGGEHYSKSYVSALERGKLSPSQKALRFFATQFALPEEYFISLLEQAETRELAGAGEYLPAERGNEPRSSLGEEEMLDVLLEHAPNYSIPALRDLPAVSLAQLVTTPSSRQAGYAYVLGMSAQQKGEYENAVRSLEYALALAPSHMQSAILDALGTTHARQHRTTVALHYHLRAYRLLKAADGNGAPASLLLSTALHCGEDYRAMGAYQQASRMYDEARSYLAAEHPMQTAATIFLGLGYSLYGLLSQQRLSLPSHRQRLSSEEREQLFQRAISLVHQGRSIYQVSGESKGEIEVLLTLAQVGLDWSDERYQYASRQDGSAKKLLEASCATLLGDVEEQCRQALLLWQKDAADGAESQPEASLIYAALASLVRLHVQRARIARISGNTDSALRERILGSSLCQEALNALSTTATLSQDRLSQWLSFQHERQYSRDPALPRLSRPQMAEREDDSSPGFVELSLAAGEVAEELGQAAQNPDYAHDCFTRADAFYMAALEHALPLVTRHAQDPGYPIRCYQRCLDRLDERPDTHQDREQETAGVLRALLSTGLSLLPAAFAPGEAS